MINETHKRILKMMGVNLSEQVDVQENQPLTPLQKIESLLNDETLTDKLMYMFDTFNVETKEDFFDSLSNNVNKTLIMKLMNTSRQKYDTDKDDLYKQIIEIMSEVLKTSDALK
jgi:hypothetical protein